MELKLSKATKHINVKKQSDVNIYIEGYVSGKRSGYKAGYEDGYKKAYSDIIKSSETDDN